MKYNILLINIIIYTFAGIGLFFTLGFFAVKYGLTNTTGIIDSQRESFLASSKSALFYPNQSWMKNTEWKTFEDAVRKDELVIKEVATKTDLSPRLIMAIAAVEQLRLFYTERALFKEAFAPLKILGVQSQFSWGVMGVKKETAETIEKNLKDKNSIFYPGEKYENLLNFKTANIKQERYDRLTKQSDRTYSYLYAALFIKEIEAQWQKAGFDISDNIAVLATLYNIGFANSKPNPLPKTGGAEIKIESIQYSFGSLAHDIYYSDKLLDIFPKN